MESNLAMDMQLLDNERKIESAKKRLDLVEDNPDMEAKVSLCVISSPSVLPPP